MHSKGKRNLSPVVQVMLDEMPDRPLPGDDRWLM
jgi:hypothetical protein